MLSTFERAMRPRDREPLERQIANLEMEIRTELKSGYVVAAVAVVAAAAIVAYVVLRHPSSAVGLLVGAGAGVIYSAVQLVKDRRTTRDMRAGLDEKRAQLAAGRVRVVRCEATEVVRLDDEEPEDAIYAFQVEPDRIFVVSGDEYHQSRGFPSEVFEISHPITNAGDEDDEILEVAAVGMPLKPVRVIPSQVTNTLRAPGDQSEIEGRLEDLEQLLARD